MSGIIERCGLWLRGNESYSSGVVIDADNMTAVVNKTYSTTGQNKDNGNKTMMGMIVDFSNIPILTIYLGFIEYFIINWFRKTAKVSKMTVDGLTKKYQGKTIMAEDFQPAEGGGRKTNEERIDDLMNSDDELDRELAGLLIKDPIAGYKLMKERMVE